MNSKKHLRRLVRRFEKETKSLNYRAKRIWKIDREIDGQKQFELSERGKL